MMFLLLVFSRSTAEDEILNELKSVRAELSEIRSILTKSIKKQTYSRPIPEYQVITPVTPKRYAYNRRQANMYIPVIFEPEEAEETSNPVVTPLNEEKNEIDGHIRGNSGAHLLPPPSQFRRPLEINRKAA